MCNSLSHHKLVITGGGRIQCEKCWGMWDMDGRELVSFGYSDWRAWRDDCTKKRLISPVTTETCWSGKNQLPAREIAHVLVEELINRNNLRDRAEINALRTEAAQNSDLFIEQVLGKTQL